MPIEGNDLERLQRETNDELGRLVLELRESRQGTASGESGSSGDAQAQPLRDVSDALGSTTSAMQELTEGLGANVSALQSAADAFASGGQGLLGALTSGLSDGSGLGSFLQSGLGLAPLASALVGLFRGGDGEETPVFETYTPPPSIQLEAAATGNGSIGAVGRGTGDEVRVTESRGAAPQVVVNVSAMDSQSFLTRSHDIARAVRDAMLHMDPLNDVIGEL